MTNGTRRWLGVSVTPRPLFTLGKNLVLIVQEAGWAPGPGWTGAENLAPIGIRYLDRPARRHSLYQLSYPGPHSVHTTERTCLHETGVEYLNTGCSPKTADLSHSKPVLAKTPSDNHGAQVNDKRNTLCYLD